jgi:hypothetical protein
MVRIYQKDCTGDCIKVQTIFVDFEEVIQVMVKNETTNEKIFDYINDLTEDEIHEKIQAIAIKNSILIYKD